MSRILVTGAAGFVGAAVCARLLDRGETVIGLDNFNAYYDVALKEARVARLTGRPGFDLVRGDLSDAAAMLSLIGQGGVDRVVHLGAQAGVRHSIDAPFDYERSNLAGHLAVLEGCRHAGVRHLVYASSSSVYGDRPQEGEAFSETNAAVRPVSLYAATKRADELMSEAYAGLYGFPQTGLRFFTVYGPWGRPDMAYFSFTRKILAGEPIEVFGEGQMARDFTYIDDIVAGILGALDNPPPAHENRILNIGAGQPVALMDMISILERALGREAEKIFRPMQPGDVRRTYADISRLAALTGYRPKVMLREGLGRFVAWYRGHYPDPVMTTAARTVSITFDDGLKLGCDIAVEVLGRHGLAATFYVVTGWVAPMRAPIREAWNVGRSHGDWDHWRAVAALGHEVGSHSFSHFNARGKRAALMPWRVTGEISKSLADLRRQVPQDSYTISMPWNAATPLSNSQVRRGYSACRLGSGAPCYNDLDDLSPYALKAWAPGPQHQIDDYVRVIDAIPPGGWLIFNFHSFEDEGWEPITAAAFDALCVVLTQRDVEVATVRDVVARLSRAGEAAERQAS